MHFYDLLDHLNTSSPFLSKGKVTLEKEWCKKDLMYYYMNSHLETIMETSQEDKDRPCDAIFSHMASTQTMKNINTKNYIISIIIT